MFTLYQYMIYFGEMNGWREITTTTLPPPNTEAERTSDYSEAWNFLRPLFSPNMAMMAFKTESTLRIESATHKLLGLLAY